MFSSLKKKAEGTNEIKLQEHQGILVISIFPIKAKNLSKDIDMNFIFISHKLTSIQFEPYCNHVTDKSIRIVLKILTKVSSVDKISFRSGFDAIFVTTILKFLTKRKILRKEMLFNFRINEECFFLFTVNKLEDYFFSDNILRAKNIESKPMIETINELENYVKIISASKTNNFIVKIFLSRPIFGILLNPRNLSTLTLDMSLNELDPMILFHISKCSVFNRVKKFAVHVKLGMLRPDLITGYCVSRIFHLFNSLEEVQISLYHDPEYSLRVIPFLIQHALASKILIGVSKVLFMTSNNRLPDIVASPVGYLFRENVVVLYHVLEKILGIEITPSFSSFYARIVFNLGSAPKKLVK
eukprot:snap_masked-scaffold_25-processed-gene-2.40-mRNA-1 protein AED:1.00 eAED:1.00 QI:0/0/0/0/1/1/2/0/355